MEPIRILQVFTILNRGGAETNIMNYYRKIDRNKIQFDFLVHREDIGVFEDEILQLGGKIFRLPPINPFKLRNYKKRLNHFFDNNTYKIIHGHCSELGFYIYKEAFRRNVPVIIAHSHNSNVNFDMKLPFRYFWKKSMMKYLNAYFSCGNLASIWLFGKEKAKFAYLMNNAIDVSNFEYNETKDLLIRTQLNACKSFNIVNVGSLIESKNHDFAIDVFFELMQINNNVKMFFIGKGKLLDKLKSKIQKLDLEDKIIFLGSRNDVNDLLQAMDLFLFPSKFEGLPLSLIECQTAGLKCVISNAIPTEAILLPDNIEVISLNESAKFWANKVKSFANTKKQNTGSFIIEKGYNIDENVFKLENKYLELLNKFDK